MIPDEDEIRERVRRASAQMAEHYVIAALPKAVMPLVMDKLNEAGVDFAVLDDGEDDGIEAICAVPNSAVMEPAIRKWWQHYLINGALFLAGALLVVWAVATHAGAWLPLLAFCMGLSAVRTLNCHREWEKRRELRAQIQSAGH